MNDEEHLKWDVAYHNYLKAHGFDEDEGWDDDYYDCDFEENWRDYIKKR